MLTLICKQWVLYELHFFQSGQESKVIIRPSVVLKENTCDVVVVSTFNPEGLDVGELPKEPAPQNKSSQKMAFVLSKVTRSSSMMVSLVERAPLIRIIFSWRVIVSWL